MVSINSHTRMGNFILRLNRRRSYRIPSQKMLCLSWENRTTTGIMKDFSIHGFSAGIDSDIAIGDIVKVYSGYAIISDTKRKARVVRQISERQYGFEFVDDQPKPTLADRLFLKPFVSIINRKKKAMMEEPNLTKAIKKINKCLRLRQLRRSSVIRRKFT